MSACTRNDWCAVIDPHNVCDSNPGGLISLSGDQLHDEWDEFGDRAFVVVCERCNTGVRTLFVHREDGGHMALDSPPTQLLSGDDALEYDPTTDSAVAQLLTADGRARGRWVFKCEECGNTARSRHDKLEPFIIGLVGHGVSEVSLSGLRAYT